MQILHITPSYKPAEIYGGPTLSISRLAEEQARSGAQVMVYTTTANGAEELRVPTNRPVWVDGVEVFYFKRWTGDHSHFSPGLLRKVWANANRFDAVHLHSWWNWVAFGTALICRWKSVNFVFSPRGMLSPYTLRNRVRIFFQRTIGQFLLRNCVMHATAQQEARELKNLLPQNPCFVLPNIIDLPNAKRVQKGNPNPFRLLFLSRIHQKKGLELLLGALEKIQPPWQLQLAGNGPANYARQIEALIGQKKMADKVHWLSWVNGEEKTSLLAESDLLVLPSFHENFANVVLEALAVGTPVLISDQVGLSEYVRANSFGWVCLPEAESIQTQLELAIASEAERVKIRQQAPQKIRADFEPGKLAKQYLEQYSWLHA